MCADRSKTSVFIPLQLLNRIAKKNGMTPKKAFNLNGEFARAGAFEKNWHRLHKCSELDLAVRDLDQERSRNWMLTLAVGIGIGLASLLAYGLTRPCVIGRCEEISRTKQQVQKLVGEFEPSATTEAQVAQQQLIESIKALQKIPAWSPSYSEARTLSLNYLNKLEALEKVVAALENEAKAEQRQKPPTVSAAEVRGFWQAAIASLEQIPQNSEFYPFAQSQIPKYQQNLRRSDRQLRAERKALKRLKQAQAAAEIAQSRQVAARSPADWQLVVATWDTAIKRLQEISAKSAIYQEGQLRKEYQTQLVAAQKRKFQEQLALNKYQEGIEQAQQAKQSESIDQWTAAVTYWRNALNALKQVPKDTAKAAQAQSLSNSYAEAFQQAQVQLQAALTRQQARSDLEKVCGDTNICGYNIKDSEIQVNLTSAYMHKVRQTALQAKAQDDLQAQVNLLDHIASVEQGLEAISKNTKLPVSVYSSQGALLVTYPSK